MATELTPEEVLAAATTPKTMMVDGQSVTTQSADDLIKLDEYARIKAARAAGKRGGARRIIFGVAVLPKHT